MPWNHPWTEIMKAPVLSSFQSLKGTKWGFFLQRVAGRRDNLLDGINEFVGDVEYSTYHRRGIRTTEK